VSRRGDCVATYLGLQGFEVISVECLAHPGRGRVKMVRIERRGGQHACPDCGRRPPAGLFREEEPIRLRRATGAESERFRVRLLDGHVAPGVYFVGAWDVDGEPSGLRKVVVLR
jgi:hypothetical protein